MFARKAMFFGRTAAFASVAALALCTIAPSDVLAASPTGKGRTVAEGVARSDATDFSARRRVYYGGGAAAAAAFAGIVGTGLAIAATQNRGAYYDGYYGGGPAYYGGPTYYGGGPYYGPGPNYPHHIYGGDSPAAACGQGYMTSCY
jgi:hypothetical protein